MQYFMLFLLSLAWPTIGKVISKRNALPNQPEVTLSRGSVLSGTVDQNASSVRQFLGIPYAQPPVEELRWEAPRANRLPSSVNATAFGRSCTQFVTTTANVFTRDVLEFNIRDANTTGEDCLTLSVWTPQHAESLPVVVFFYGGGWYAGGQDIPYQIPTQWVQRTRDLIVVVPNFRGNIFGFPNARGAEDQNLGLLDQRLAVEWVRDNIKSFGGDPGKITIWGQSSGAEAVDIYNYAWYQDPIVKGLIMDSGTVFIENGQGPRYSNFSYVASHVGCGNTSNAQEELACMKKVDAAKLENFVAKENDEGSTSGLAFGPPADEKIVFSNYTNRAQQGKLTKVPAIIGINKQDGNVFAPYNASGPDPALSELYFLEIFLCTSYKTATENNQRYRLRAAAGLPTYRYLYAGNFSNISPRPWLGAYHQSELPLLFGTHGNYRGPSTNYETAVSNAMQDAWRAFANDPEHGLVGQHWPKFTLERDVVRSFGENGTVARNGVVAGR
ncbi:MAG: hypothetical protein M1820_002576 [Bogoriella megaspora]|nr:MAG: hypothetical protein M1820_002576 [Bogoriella megaspora]